MRQRTSKLKEFNPLVVSAILAAKRMSRDSLMYKLSLLGWTSVEIGQFVGMTDGGVRSTVYKLKEFNLETIKSDFYDKGKQVEERF